MFPGRLANDCGVGTEFDQSFDDEFGLLEEEEVAADFSEDFVVGGGGFGFRVHGVVAGAEGGEVGAGGGFSVGGAVEVIELGDGFFGGVGIDEGRGVTADPWDEAVVEDVGGHGGFQLGMADEEDDGEESVLGEGEEVHEGTDVEPVLMEGILEAVFAAVDLLGPLALVFAAEDPATVVFGFDDEDAEGGDEDVVDLGGAGLGGMREVEIVEVAVLRRIEGAEAAIDHGLAQPAFEGGGGEELEDQEKDKPADKDRPMGEDGREEGMRGHVLSVTNF